MSESIADVHKRVLNHGAKWTDFPVGTHVKIVALCEDMTFFYGETGVITRSSPDYLGITVQFDEPRHYEPTTAYPDGYIQYDFNFKPQSLVVISTPKMQSVTKHLMDRLYRVLGDKDVDYLQRILVVELFFRRVAKFVAKPFELIAHSIHLHWVTVYDSQKNRRRDETLHS